MLAQLRHNRAKTQEWRNRLDPSNSADCTSPFCSQLDNPPTCRYIDTIPHILAKCERHSASRQQLRLALAVADPNKFSSTRPLALELYLGELYRKVTSQLVPRIQLAFRCLKDYFYSILRERGGDARLLPLFCLPAHNDA
jgi:hypothetical protein